MGVLYFNLIDATTNIVKQFGQGIVHEERFVNILSDLYPERDNPAIFRIIKSVIQDDLLRNVLDSNAKSIEHQVASATSIMAKQYGYDQSLVEGILYSLAIGYGTLSKVDYLALTPQQNKSPKKQSSNQQNNNPSQNKKNPFKPNRQNKIPNQQPVKYYAVTVKHTAILVWGILGLLVSPFVYASQICVNHWWPQPTSILIALIHFFTILPISVFFESDSSTKRKQVHPALQGGFCALYILAILFWMIFPFLFGIQRVQTYWGFFPNKNGFPFILTIIANLFCAFLLFAVLNQSLSNIAANLSKNEINIWANLQKLLGIHSFRKGFLLVLSIFVLVAITAYSIPIVKKVQTKHKIEAFNKQIDTINQQKDSLKNERSKTERNLSFAQFKLGDSIFACISKIKDEDEYNFSNSTYDFKLTVNEVDYEDIADSIIHLKTDWNNEKIDLDLFFNKQKLFAIQFTPYQTSSDSILASYTAKYGEPEYHLSRYKYIESKNDIPEYYYLLDIESDMKSELTPKHFSWTYKHSLIKIDCKHNNSYINEVATITYFDRIAESVLLQYKEEQVRKERAYEQRINDSLRHVREETERKREEQRRQIEFNHKESMKQI